MMTAWIMNGLGILLLLTVSGCALLTPAGPEGSVAGPFAEAERRAGLGNYQEAREEYLRIAAAEPGSPVAEEAMFRSARLLVSSGNPAKSYSRASREFEIFLHEYPSGRFADDAAAWLAALQAVQQSKVETLLEEVAVLARRIDEADAARGQVQADRDAAVHARDALIAEREGLKAKLERALREKSELNEEKEKLLRDRNSLEKDKKALEKKVAGLRKDKERLMAAKAVVEKRLLDLTAIDVNMEKKRKKTK